MIDLSLGMSLGVTCFFTYYFVRDKLVMVVIFQSFTNISINHRRLPACWQNIEHPDYWGLTD